MHPPHSRWTGPGAPKLSATCGQCSSRVIASHCACYPTPPAVSPPPKLYITNAASVRTDGMAGAKHRRIGIIESRTKYGIGVGSLPLFVPSFELEEDMRIDRDEWPRHNRLFAAELWSRSRGGELLVPGKLLFRRGRRRVDGPDARPFAAVKGGDTLLCTCGRAKAAKGECHRVLVASCLSAFGWSVILDGVALDPHNSSETTPAIDDNAATEAQP